MRRLLVALLVGGSFLGAVTASHAAVPLPLSTLDWMVSRVVGVPVVVECDEPTQVVPGVNGYASQSLAGAGDDGFTYGDGVLHVSTSECVAAESVYAPRVRFPAGYVVDQAGERADLESGPALEVILHEAFHNGLHSSDEALVECTTIENAWQLVRQFGLPAWRARILLAGFQWRHEQATGVYREDC